MEKIEELEQKIAELQNEIDKLKQQQNNRYPMKLIDLGSWNTIGSGNKYDFNKYLKFARLVETCKEWNRIDGFVPDWDDDNWDDNDSKFCIICVGSEFKIDEYAQMRRSLYFISRETAQLFLYTFRTELESVKDLL